MQAYYNNVFIKMMMLSPLGGVKLRVKLILSQWRLLLMVFLVFNVTLMVFPGISSEVQYCDIKDWSPVIMVLAFNFTDFISRVRYDFTT